MFTIYVAIRERTIKKTKLVNVEKCIIEKNSIYIKTNFKEKSNN